MGEHVVDKFNYTPILACYGLPKSFGDTLSDLEKHTRDRFFVYTLVENINRSTSLDQKDKRAKLIDLVTKYELDHYIIMLTHEGPIFDSDFWEIEKRAHLLLHTMFYPWEEIKEYIELQEEILIKWMILPYDTRQILDFFEFNETGFEEAQQSEKVIWREELEAHFADGFFDIAHVYYKIPWTSACELVSEQLVLTLGGTSWVPGNKIKRVIPTLFADHLKHERERQVYHYVIHRFISKDQINILCNLLYPVYCKNSEMSECEDLDFALEDINDYIHRFPPCFRRIQDRLNTRHHLKFEARRQYFMTFASLQPNPDELKDYMKSQFVSRGHLNEAAFHEHEYLIDHTFGEVGSRIVYRSPDCRLYVNEHQGIAGDCSGCPFGGHGDCGDKDLEKLMTSWRIKPQDQAKVILHKRARKASMACGAFFQAVHGIRPRQEIVNPIIYYNESVRVEKFGNNIPAEGDDLDEFIYEQLHQYAYEDDWSIEDAEQRWAVDYRLRKRYYEGPGSRVLWKRDVGCEGPLEMDAMGSQGFMSSSSLDSDAEETDTSIGTSNAGDSDDSSSIDSPEVTEKFKFARETLDEDISNLEDNSTSQTRTCSHLAHPPKIRKVEVPENEAFSKILQ